MLISLNLYIFFPRLILLCLFGFKVRIKNIITQYVGDRDGCGIEELIKELMQNSDDAQATEVCTSMYPIIIPLVLVVLLLPLVLLLVHCTLQ